MTEEEKMLAGVLSFPTHNTQLFLILHQAHHFNSIDVMMDVMMDVVILFYVFLVRLWIRLNCCGAVRAATASEGVVLCNQHRTAIRHRNKEQDSFTTHRTHSRY